jgi:hypothetical protein
MVEHDLPWHCLPADRQGVIERQAIGRGVDRPACLHDRWPCGAACATYGELALRSLIASEHGSASSRSQPKVRRYWDTTVAIGANRSAGCLK